MKVFFYFFFNLQTCFIHINAFICSWIQGGWVILKRDTKKYGFLGKFEADSTDWEVDGLLLLFQGGAWVIAALNQKLGFSWSSWSSSSREGRVSCVFSTVNLISNRAAVQGQTKFFNQKYERTLSAWVERCFYLLWECIHQHGLCSRHFNVIFIHAYSY